MAQQQPAGFIPDGFIPDAPPAVMVNGQPQSIEDYNADPVMQEGPDPDLEGFDPATRDFIAQLRAQDGPRVPWSDLVKDPEKAKQFLQGQFAVAKNLATDPVVLTSLILGYAGPKVYRGLQRLAPVAKNVDWGKTPVVGSTIEFGKEVARAAGATRQPPAAPAPSAPAPAPPPMAAAPPAATPASTHIPRTFRNMKGEVISEADFRRMSTPKPPAAPVSRPPAAPAPPADPALPSAEWQAQAAARKATMQIPGYDAGYQAMLARRPGATPPKSAATPARGAAAPAPRPASPKASPTATASTTPAATTPDVMASFDALNLTPAELTEAVALAQKGVPPHAILQKLMKSPARKLAAKLGTPSDALRLEATKVRNQTGEWPDWYRGKNAVTGGKKAK